MKKKFIFSQFEDLESHLANTYLADVIGVIISFTNMRDMKRPNGQHCMMRDLTIQNLSNLDTKGIKDTPVVVVVSSTYVRKYPDVHQVFGNNTSPTNNTS
ncbi:hypothetical protein MKX03_028768 [Papaver bracteatum]|nr:hypothetical protein MKX03_028768 [Papaver bracteatum]